MISTNNILKYGYLLFVILLTISTFIHFTDHQNRRHVSDIFYQSDFLINYNAGFVRRGLDGQFLYYLSELLNLKSKLIIKLYEFTTFLVFNVVFFAVVKKYRIPLVFIFSMAGFLLYLYNAAPVRKDHILLLNFILLILFIIKKNGSLKYFEIVFASIFISISILQHELFFLISFFPLLLIFYYNKKTSTFIELTIVPCVIFLITILFSGTIEQRDLIITSWEKIGVHDVGFNKGVFESNLYFWSFQNTSFTYIYTFLVFVIQFCFTFLCCFSYLNNSQRKYFFILLLLQYGVMLVLCLVAIDFGRWVFFANITSVLTIYLIKTNKPDNQPPSITKLKFLPYLLSPIITMPFFLVQEQSLASYFNVMPISIIINTFKQIVP